MLECECFTVHGCNLGSEQSSARAILPVHRKYNLRRKLKQKITSTNLLGAWRRNVVEPYTDRQLTKSSDRLVALSAIAFEFSKKLSCQYLAGIWKEDLHGGLLWRCNEISNAHVAGAPSWSWASVQGSVSWLKQSFGAAFTPDIVAVEYATSPDNPFGHTHAASITFQAEVIEGRLAHIPAPKSGSILTSTYGLEVGKANFVDVSVDVNVEPIEVMKEDGSVITSARRTRDEEDKKAVSKSQYMRYEGVYCLRMGSNIALVLGPTSSRSEIFERLGLCLSLGAKTLSWKKRNITIV
jgi:hypothetical protein